MSPQDAIAKSTVARQTPGACWPAALISYLAKTFDEKLAIDWVISCVEDLLDYLGKASQELRSSIAFARNHSSQERDIELIEQLAQSHWKCRSSEGYHYTAMAQLLFSFSRGDRMHNTDSFATPICLLEKLEGQQGEVFDRVVMHFLSFIDAVPENFD